MSAFPELSDELIARLDVSGPRYTSYPTAPEWTEASAAEGRVAALAAASEHPAAPLGLYMHLPFCRERCTFCGCNVVITRETDRADEYIELLTKEMDLAGESLGARKKLAQLHWGGGTPTFLEEPQLERLWARITDRFELLDDAEVSIEVDPRVTTKSQLRLLRQLGFNRISMGVQDFDYRVQEAINRQQSFEDTQDLTDFARAEGFGSVNFDLIQGLPRQTTESWAKTLELVLSIRPDRLAVYSFAFVPGAKPHQKRLPIQDMPTGTTKLALFRDAYNTFVDAGYKPIGMDHFALPDDELAKAQEERKLFRNFQGYTVRAATDTVAFGVTAISDVQGAYSQNYPQMAKYRRALEEGRLPTVRGLTLNEDDLVRRDLITRLMCNFWVDLGEHRFDSERARLEDLQEQGLLELRGSEIELTPVGRIFVRNVAMVFDTYLEASAHEFSRTV